MKHLVLLSLLLIFNSCGKKNSGGGSNSEGGSPELTPEQAQARVKMVVGAIISGVNLNLNQQSFSQAAAFAPQIEMCEAVKYYYEHFGDGSCSNSCPEPDLFHRSCAGEAQSSSCGSREYSVNYEEHLMKWDMSEIETIGNRGVGTSTFEVEASGLATGSEFENVPFSCSVTFKANAYGSTSSFVCDGNFNMNCQIDGVDYECQDLRNHANEVRACAGEFDSFD